VPHASPPLILIVDDFQDNREMYSEYLRAMGYAVAESGDGASAIAMTHELKPALVVMDLSLPVVDGWEAIRRIKGDPSTAHVPIIALTGHVLQIHSQTAKAAGCDAFVTKPCLPDDLLVEIQRLVGPLTSPAIA
jgi:CheY-like chemotaxis protein